MLICVATLRGEISRSHILLLNCKLTEDDVEEFVQSLCGKLHARGAQIQVHSLHPRLRRTVDDPYVERSDSGPTETAHTARDQQEKQSHSLRG